ncbi:MAG: HEAT repeat domain-containing protein [Bacteroidota bacterium]|nr:HEAT repeat domain-containing protein [Bacteroidota bacterium]MDP4216101.1 HEAT repeat domain-containing protein [Bacteroidota bacterium]MDP4245279.1 HEAT repeat domain-containing protein [Bacteroidota bacterium]MDP4253064.1 HEAT repeat domain-containing protein [Bacteroidota bacterium]MDP4260211.1 HEAT repeat domain-containing protein [Bacteroidota bacterium]
MTRLTIFIYALFTAFASFGQQAQTEKDFKADFIKALDKNFTDTMLDKLFLDYGELLTPHSAVTRLTASLANHEMSSFPLYDFKSEKLYVDNISGLLNSRNPNHRILAYLVIASSFDTAREPVLLDRIETEKNKGNLIWAGMALLYLNTKHTTALFDFLVKNEDFGDAHMIPLFFQLDKDSLQQTAYNRINSRQSKAKILAAQVLAYTPLNAKTEELLKHAVQTWDLNLKGYAIFSVKELQIGNLLETCKPLLDHQETRSISLEAMANSPTEADRSFLVYLVGQHDTVPAELLDCFYKSKRIDNMKYWLKLLYTRPIPVKYIFFSFEQPLLSSDSILPDLQSALRAIANKGVLGELVGALKNRIDDNSIEIMISLLKNKSSTVRYWTAMTAKSNPSIKLKTPEVKDLIARGLKDGDSPDD